MRRLLAWLLSFWPADPNLDRRDDWEPRPVSDFAEPACILCPRPALQDGLCGAHMERSRPGLSRLLDKHDPDICGEQKS